MQIPTNRQSILNPTEAWWAGVSPRDDRGAAGLLQSEHNGGRHQRTVYELFSEMEEKDGHLYSTLQTRINGVLGLNRRVIPAGPAGEEQRKVAEYIQNKIDRFPRFDEFLRALLEAVSRGFSVVELIWDYDDDGHLAIVDWIAHPQEWFSFSENGSLKLLSPPFRRPETGANAVAPITGRTTVLPNSSFAPPPRKFVSLRFGADQRNPFGRGLCQRAYWLYFFKKNVLKFWAIYHEKYGAPTAVASYGPGATSEDRENLRSILEALQTESGIVIPESIELRLLEQNRNAAQIHIANSSIGVTTKFPKLFWEQH